MHEEKRMIPSEKRTSHDFRHKSKAIGCGIVVAHMGLEPCRCRPRERGAIDGEHACPRVRRSWGGTQKISSRPCPAWSCGSSSPSCWGQSWQGCEEEGEKKEDKQWLLLVGLKRRAEDWPISRERACLTRIEIHDLAFHTSLLIFPPFVCAAYTVV